MSDKELKEELRRYLELFAELKHEDVDAHPRRTLNHIRHIVGCWEVFERRLELATEKRKRRPSRVAA